MLDTLYENIGEKIKNWAKWIFIIEAISAVISGFVLIGNDDGVTGVIVLLAGPFVAWVGSWLLYAFGQVVEDVHALRNKECPEELAAPATSALFTKSTLENDETEEDETNEEEIEDLTRPGDKLCQLCNGHFDQVTYCKIVDDWHGTRYRSICNNCIRKYRATPQK